MAKGDDERFNKKRRVSKDSFYQEPDPASPYGIQRPQIPGTPYDWAKDPDVASPPAKNKPYNWSDDPHVKYTPNKNNWWNF